VSQCAKDTENGSAPLAMAFIGARKRTLAGKKLVSSKWIDDISFN
jgi:hypothetical protein